MSQERLIELALMTIENDLLDKVDVKSVVDDFVKSVIIVYNVFR